MNPDTLLLRQIHPSFRQQGRVTSQAFRPTPKDEDRLSFDDGDKIEAKAALERHVARGSQSIGVLAVAVGECAQLDLPVEADGEPYPEHVSIVFSGLSNGQKQKRGKKLAKRANERGWIFQPGEHS